MEPKPMFDRLRAEGELAVAVAVAATGSMTEVEEDTTGGGAEVPNNVSRLFRYCGSALISICKLWQTLKS